MCTSCRNVWVHAKDGFPGAGTVDPEIEAQKRGARKGKAKNGEGMGTWKRKVETEVPLQEPTKVMKRNDKSGEGGGEDSVMGGEGAGV